MRHVIAREVGFPNLGFDGRTRLRPRNANPVNVASCNGTSDAAVAYPRGECASAQLDSPIATSRETGYAESTA
ncbi:MAG: hypothetical protein AAF539_11995, partial [Planctomycetota bacterium]